METNDHTCEGCKFYFAGECRRDVLNPRRVNPYTDYCWIRERETPPIQWRIGGSMMEAKTIHQIIDETLVVVPGDMELHYMHTIGLKDGVRGCIAGLKKVIAADAVPVSGTLRTYDPATHIVVSRDSLAALLDYWFGDCPNDKFASACQGADKLRAALEVK